MEPALSRWDDSDHMLALTVDALAALVWMFRAVHFKGGDRIPVPRPMWRPTDPDPVNGADALAAYDELMKTIERQTGAPRGIAVASEEAPRGD